MKRYEITVYINEDSPEKAIQRVNWGFDESMSYEDKCKFRPNVTKAREILGEE